MAKPSLFLAIALLLSPFVRAAPDNDVLLTGDCSKRLALFTERQAALCLISAGSRDRDRIERLLAPSIAQGDSGATYQLGLFRLKMGDAIAARQSFALAGQHGSKLANAQLKALDAEPESHPRVGEIRRAVLTGDIDSLDRFARMVSGHPSFGGTPLLDLALGAGQEQVATWLVRHDVSDSARPAILRQLKLAIAYHMHDLAGLLSSTLGDIPGPDRAALLSIAIRDGDTQIIGRLAHGCSATNGPGKLAGYVYDKGDDGITRALAEGGCPLNDMQQAWFVHLSTWPASPLQGHSLLSIAAMSGTPSAFTTRVAAGDDLWKDASLTGPVATLYKYGQGAVVRRMLEEAHSRVPGAALLQLAVMQRDAPTLATLVARTSFDPGDYAGLASTPLWIAAGNGESVWRPLLGWQTDQHLSDKYGRDLVMHALEMHDPGLAIALVRAGFPATGQDASGRTALWYAARMGNAEALPALVHAPRDIDIADRLGRTPLLIAVARGQKDAAITALSLNADANRATVAGNTPLMLAAEGNPALVSILLDHHADYTRRNKASLTALMIAAQQGCKPCGKQLADAGANPHRKDARGRSALDMAPGPHWLD